MGTAGKGAILNFGVGAHEVGCYGEPGVTDTCQDLTFNLPPNAITTPGMAFFCDGLTCPPNTPEPFSNLFGAQSSTCSKGGDCGCNAGTSDVCTVDCITGTDACKDGTIRCNNDGFDCIVNCMSESSCSGSTTEPNQPTATNPQPQNTGNNPAIPANPGPANPGPANPGNVVQPNPVTPQTRPPVVQNMLCCQTAIQGFKPWQGRCWGLQTIGDCQSEPNECCSEVCIGGTGQTIPAGQAVGGGPGVGTCR